MASRHLLVQLILLVLLCFPCGNNSPARTGRTFPWLVLPPAPVSSSVRNSSIVAPEFDTRKDYLGGDRLESIDLCRCQPEKAPKNFIFPGESLVVLHMLHGDNSHTENAALNQWEGMQEDLQCINLQSGSPTHVCAQEALLDRKYLSSFMPLSATIPAVAILPKDDEVHSGEYKSADLEDHSEVRGTPVREELYLTYDSLTGVSVVLLGACISSLIVIYFWLYQALMRKNTKRRETFFRLNGQLLLKKQISLAVDIKIFAMEEVERATDNFNDGRIIGRGGSSIVYKGMLPDGTVVAIKKATDFDENRIDEFTDEISILSQINHKNMVKLLGCCLETQVPLLVYEFVPNGTLSQHLHDHIASVSFLTWEYRLKIAAEVAGALSYMHSLYRPIIHRDIKSSNILLDGNFSAKVSDLGVSRLFPVALTHLTTLVRGTRGYLDPEYFQSGQLTEKSDVYSFGVVLAELMTSKKAIFTTRMGEVESLANHFVRSIKGNSLFQILDPSLVDERNIDELHMVAMIAERCLRSMGKERPNMKDVAAELLHLISKEKSPRKRRGFKKILAL